jgi:hypothetical protein
VYPNPATRLLTLEINKPLQDAVAELFDLNGKLVWQRTGITEGTLSIDLSGNAKGIYFLRVKDGETPVFSKKILLQNQ